MWAVKTPYLLILLAVSVICAMLPDNDNNFCSIDLSTELAALLAYCGFIQYQRVNLVSTCVQICETATGIIAAWDRLIQFTSVHTTMYRVRSYIRSIQHVTTRWPLRRSSSLCVLSPRCRYLPGSISSAQSWKPSKPVAISVYVSYVDNVSVYKSPLWIPLHVVNITQNLLRSSLIITQNLLRS